MNFEGGQLPSAHQLFAALDVLELLPLSETPIDRVRNSYRLLPSDGVYGSEDFLTGEHILVIAGYAERSTSEIWRATDTAQIPDGATAAEILLADFMGKSQLPWIGAATRDFEVRPELVPVKVEAALATTFESAERREAFLLSVGQKHSESELRQLGEEGELSVIESWKKELVSHGRSDLIGKIVHVSQRSDVLGYDVVAPDLAGIDVRVEVKAVGATRRHLTIHLSRNEFETGVRDGRWRLVVCRRDPTGSVVIEGWLKAMDLTHSLPTDTSDFATWSSARIRLAAKDIEPGLPIRATQYPS